PPLTNVPNNGIMWLDSADSSAIVKEAGLRLKAGENGSDLGELTDSVSQKKRQLVRGDKIVTVNDRPVATKWNDGEIEVINTEPEWSYGDYDRKRSFDRSFWSIGDCKEFSIDNVRYRVPERRIKLEFVEKTIRAGHSEERNETDPIDRYPSEDPSYHCRLGELYSPSERAPVSNALIDSSHSTMFKDEDDVETWLTGLSAFQTDIARHLIRRRQGFRKSSISELVEAAN
ncbi:hypothetical protein HDU93_002534, partial [Gonapodya sp. JEL0774]